MRIFIVGGTGFIGQALIPNLLAAGHTVKALVRSPGKADLLPAGVEAVSGDPMTPGPWQDEVRAAESIINLAGYNIFARWTRKNKELIRTSRINTTKNIVDAITADTTHPQTLINASAVGYFGAGDDEEKNEDAPAGDDFLARVCVDWEKEAFKACHKGTRVVTTRIGIVLGKSGGALAKMLPAFRLGVAGRLGSGQQWFPWIHIDDLVAIFRFCIDQPEVSGPINCCAPQPVRNMEFTQTMGEILHRPTLLPVPAWAVKLALGELGMVVLEGSRMVPGALLKHGFSFHYPDIHAALREILLRK